jgi:hypothetical protein
LIDAVVGNNLQACLVQTTDKFKSKAAAAQWGTDDQACTETSDQALNVEPIIKLVQ